MTPCREKMRRILDGHKRLIEFDRRPGHAALLAALEPRRDIAALRAESAAAEVAYAAAQDEVERLHTMLAAARRTEAAAYKKACECSEALAHEEQLEEISKEVP